MKSCVTCFCCATEDSLLYLFNELQKHKVKLWLWCGVTEGSVKDRQETESLQSYNHRYEHVGICNSGFWRFNANASILPCSVTCWCSADYKRAKYVSPCTDTALWVYNDLWWLESSLTNTVTSRYGLNCPVLFKESTNISWSSQ